VQTVHIGTPAVHAPFHPLPHASLPLFSHPTPHAQDAEPPEDPPPISWRPRSTPRMTSDPNDVCCGHGLLSDRWVGGHRRGSGTVGSHLIVSMDHFFVVFFASLLLHRRGKNRRTTCHRHRNVHRERASFRFGMRTGRVVPVGRSFSVGTFFVGVCGWGQPAPFVHRPTMMRCEKRPGAVTLSPVPVIPTLCPPMTTHRYTHAMLFFLTPLQRQTDGSEWGGFGIGESL
jgi:hypothetical protein